MRLRESKVWSQRDAEDYAATGGNRTRVGMIPSVM
jgi:hypothetical protein